MIFDWKKIGLWGGGITALGVIGYWLYQYQQTAAANNAATQAADSQDQNQALAALLQQPLSGGTSNEPAEVSGPSVDTGSESLQQLINSILNPSSGTVSPTPTPSQPIVAQPTGGGGDTGTGSIPVSSPSPLPVTTGPAKVTAPPGTQAPVMGTIPNSFNNISPAHLMNLTSATSLPQ